jgi:colanic acid/amylovoran biosynthesis protein
VRLIETPLAPALLKAVYGGLDAFIGTRMHSNIFALSSGVPTVAIGYQFKTLGIAQSVGIEAWVLDIESLEASTLVQRLAALWAEQDRIRAHLRQTIPSLARRAAEAGQLIAADFHQSRSGELP